MPAQFDPCLETASNPRASQNSGHVDTGLPHLSPVGFVYRSPLDPEECPHSVHSRRDELSIFGWFLPGQRSVLGTVHSSALLHQQSPVSRSICRSATRPPSLQNVDVIFITMVVPPIGPFPETPFRKLSHTFRPRNIGIRKMSVAPSHEPIAMVEGLSSVLVST